MERAPARHRDRARPCWRGCFAGLVTSFSQSSIAALLLGLALLAAWRWSLRGTLAASAGLLALGAALVLLAPASLHFGLKGSSGSTSNATSGRTKLISGGLELFAQRPLQGYGSGSFETEYKRHRRTNAENATSASHTIPVTVAAEQGVVGLAVYLALLVAAFVVLFRGAGRSPPRIAIAACFAALVLHTWTYADFLEDPFTWALLRSGSRSPPRLPPAARRAPARSALRCSSGASAGPRGSPRRHHYLSTVLGYLKRLVTTGAAYQFGDIVAKGLALLTLPLYTHHVAPQGYGAAEMLLTAVILSSIVLRVGRRGGVHPLLLRRRRCPATRSHRAHGHGDRRVDDDARVRSSRSRSRNRSRGCCSASTTRN